MSLLKDKHGYLKLPAMIGILLMGIAILASGIGWGVAYMDERGCSRKEDLYERETKYDLFAGGCFVLLDDGTWIDSEKYRRYDQVEEQ